MATRDDPQMARRGWPVSLIHVFLTSRPGGRPGRRPDRPGPGGGRDPAGRWGPSVAETPATDRRRYLPGMAARYSGEDQEEERVSGGLTG
jgi:hypothetical protein